MTRFSYVMSTEPGERFTRDAFARQIGKRLPLQVNGHECGRVTVVSAEVSPDGTAVEITVDLAAQREETVTEPRRIVAEYCPGCGETHYPARTGAAEYCRTCQYYGRDRAAQQEESE